MPVIAMKVTSAAQHSNAERLRVYTMEAPGFSPLTIVANLTNVYQEGDVAAVATVGTTVKDGDHTMTISQAKIRGVESFGMAMGKVDAAPGTDLSERYFSTL